MAKTRIKTTPTRFQKDALTAELIKKRIRHVRSTQSKAKDALGAVSSVLVAPPKRTNSISSATSSISLASDAHSTTNSDSEHVTGDSIAETPGAQPDPSLEPLHISNNIATSTAKSTSSPLNIPALKNRKVFVITERSAEQFADAATDGGSNNETLPVAQKRKMYLIMEETPQQPQPNHPVNSNGSSLKNDSSGNISKKKLTLFADKCDPQLTQKFEQILPEILQRINNKVNKAQITKESPSVFEPVTVKQQNGDQPSAAPLRQPKREAVLGASNHSAMEATSAEEPPRAPITLPPKKNRMKIVNTASLVQAAAAPNAAAAATATVIVSPSQLLTAATAAKYGIVGSALNGNGGPGFLHPAHQKKINLSADFLFLMKMLPKLEAIPEPHKNHVKNCIEKIVTQNASLFQEQ